MRHVDLSVSGLSATLLAASSTRTVLDVIPMKQLRQRVTLLYNQALQFLNQARLVLQWDANVVKRRELPAVLAKQSKQ